jgi:glutamyl-tRNA synthetase
MNTEFSSKPIVTRFAPSPTGFLHIGSIRTALFAYLFARQNNGTFIVRIEDTDTERSIPGVVEHLQESLRWVGLDWDYGPDKPGPFGSCIQSERLSIYHQYAQKLVDKGLAYSDPYTEEEVAAFREKAEVEKRPFLYRQHRPENLSTQWDKTKPLRLKVSEIKRYTWTDAVRGELSAGEEMLDDVVLIKSDGYPTYNFAHIVDDYEMGVTHIMRGDEFISSTPKFLSIYDALQIPYPIFVTLPPIMRDDGKKKLGKRDGAKDVLEYRTDGYLPEVMVNFLALIGWNPGTDQEIFSLAELISEFDIRKIQRSGGAFNQTKLLWMNKQYLSKLSDESFLNYLKTTDTKALTGVPHDTVKRALPTIRERISVRAELDKEGSDGSMEFAYLKAVPTYETALLRWKNDTSVAEVLPRLIHASALLNTADFSSTETIKASLWPYAEEVGKGEVLWPLRVALSGAAQSPDPFTLAYILGRVETLHRIHHACGKISSNVI